MRHLCLPLKHLTEAAVVWHYGSRCSLSHPVAPPVGFTTNLPDPKQRPSIRPSCIRCSWSSDGFVMAVFLPPLVTVALWIPDSKMLSYFTKEKENKKYWKIRAETVCFILKSSNLIYMQSRDNKPKLCKIIAQIKFKVQRMYRSCVHTFPLVYLS